MPCAGAGAFEVALAHHLRTETKRSVQGRAKLGIEAFAEAVLGFPKILAENSGHDPQECIIRLQVRRVWWGTRVRVGLWAKVGGVGIIPWMQHAKCGSLRLTTACWFHPLRVWPQEEQEKGALVGLDVATGEPLDPSLSGIYDNYIVKKQILQSSPVVISQLLLVDEVIRAGINMRRQ